MRQQRVLVKISIFAHLKIVFMKFIGIIPARYASSRFPGKPLAMLGGKTVIQRVYEQVSNTLEEAFVATDDQRIFDEVVAFGGKAVMTSTSHQSGTDRIQEAVKLLNPDCDVVLNIQGDEPFIQEQQINTLCRCFDDRQTQIATLGKLFEHQNAVENPNSPKIVVNRQGYAMYFSRSVIPFIRNKQQENWFKQYPFLKHIGIYAYRRDVLEEITQLPPSSLELAESLEQLRWLQNGYRIKVGLTDIETVGIDTPEDLEKAERLLKELHSNK